MFDCPATLLANYLLAAGHRLRRAYEFKTPKAGLCANVDDKTCSIKKCKPKIKKNAWLCAYSWLAANVQSLPKVWY
jgi:hypothetical protein